MTDEPEIETGPFCRHFGSLGDCDEICLREGCGHPCRYHGEKCRADGCSCEGLVWESNGELRDAGKEGG